MQSAEPASGTSSTSIPAALYQPSLMAMANGAVAALTVFAHQPTFTGVSPGAGAGAPASNSTAARPATMTRTFME